MRDFKVQVYCTLAANVLMMANGITPTAAIGRTGHDHDDDEWPLKKNK